MKYLFALLLVINTAIAAPFPSGPVKIIIPLPAGSGPDAMARQLAEKLTERWRQPVVIENKPGANGAIAMETFVSEMNNGTVLYLATSENIVSFPILYSEATFHKVAQPVAPFFKNDLMLFTSSRNRDWRETQMQIVRRPIFGTQAIGSSSHLAGLELGQYVTKQKSIAIPYKEYSQWFVDIANQEVTYGFATVASSKGLEQTGKLRYIATTGSQRNPDYPAVPTMRELVSIDVTNVGWLAFYANKNLSATNKQILMRDLSEVIRSQNMADRLTSVSYQPYEGSLADFEQQVRSDTARFQKLIKKYDIKVN
ncbi:PBP2_Bug_TTT domain containing protein [uncultured Caudovirales phage]|uniref:PBP2_Bug_TTT domain containing protein n=1 Tax=uncultured Caudovirales phage TaxID=2100421 RepID=A0A6J5L7K0_9CAUD|nr:PBP2_Bug_TTT domain containing protein [uncultured Caudovirales phage]